MAHENKPGNPGAQPEERNLILRPRNTNIQSLPEGNILERVRFSPQLPERLRRLNDVLAPESTGVPIAGLEITMFPGKTPIIETNFEPAYTYFVKLSSARTGRASIMIGTRGDNMMYPGRAFTLRDIQNFVSGAFPGTPATMYAQKRVESHDFNEPLQNVSQEVVNTFTELIEERVEDGWKIKGTDFSIIDDEIRLEGQRESLIGFSLDDLWNTDSTKTVVLRLHRFFFEGSTEDVERVMDAVTQLFNKQNPYRRQETENT